ncbi:hypothetical protein K438DRAFT_458641 [Mycena galopus ATCC 62051]|nr:hypothetical protein K438DRAFT_458641 [Mycena galopus ATCC 62051]
MFSLVAEALVVASDAPVVGVLKPFVGLANLACQKFQTVHNYNEAVDRLQEQAIRIQGLITNFAEEGVPLQIRPQVDDIVRILDEVDRVLDKRDLVITQPNRKPWKRRLWITAARELDQVSDLRTRLRDALVVLNVCFMVAIGILANTIFVSRQRQRPLG